MAERCHGRGKQHDADDGKRRGGGGGEPGTELLLAYPMRLRARRSGLDLSVRELLGELAAIGETVLLYQAARAGS